MLLWQAVLARSELEFSGGFDELHSFCSNNFAPQRNSDSSQDQDNPKEREHREESIIVHCYFRTTLEGYMLFCNWSTATGHSDICASF